MQVLEKSYRGASSHVLDLRGDIVLFKGYKVLLKKRHLLKLFPDYFLVSSWMEMQLPPF